MPKPGNINHLKLQEETLADPVGEEVQIEVKAIGFNFADIFAMQGLYDAAPKGEFIPGLEFSGVISKVGSEVTQWKEGDRIMGATKFGGYVSALNHHQRYITKLPDAWSFEEGAGFIVQGLTAYYALCELGNLQKGMGVLIHSGAGGVGILANRICKKFDAYTIGSVGSNRKVDFLLKEEGYNEVFVRGDKMLDQIRAKQNGHDINIVLETIGGKGFFDSYKAMAPMGRLITFGSASFTSNSAKPNLFQLIPKYLKRPKLDVMKMPRSNKSVMGFNLIWIYDRVELLHSVLDKLMGLDLKPQYIGHTFEFNQLHDAIKLFRSGQTMGKVVVKV